MFDKGRTRLTGTLLKIRGRSKAELTLASFLGSVVAKGLNSLYFSRLYCSIAYDLVHADTELRL